MTLASPLMRIAYAGNGISVVFTVPFVFFANADLRVFLRAADGSETEQAETTHYTVAGAGDPDGGTITFLLAPASGETVVILRDPAATQETDYIEAGPFPAETHERALDKLTMLAQRATDRLDRSLAPGETDTDGTGAFRARSNRITGLAAPSHGTDAVRKSDLDAAITATGVVPNPWVEFAESPSPPDPASDHLRLFARDVAGQTRLVVRDSAGSETDLHATTPPDDSVTNARLADMAAKRFKARTSAGTGDPEDLTVEQAFSMADQLGLNTAPAPADELLIRDAAAGLARRIGFADYLKIVPALPEIAALDENDDLLLALEAGTPGKIKPRNLPSGVVTLGSFTHTTDVAEVVFTDIPSGFAGLLLMFSGVSGTASSPSFSMQVSEDNGATFLSTGYAGVLADVVNGIVGTPASVFDLGVTLAAGSGFSGAAILIGHAAPSGPRPLFSALTETLAGQYVTCGPIDALRMFWGSGNIDGGSITLCGVR